MPEKRNKQTFITDFNRVKTSLDEIKHSLSEVEKNYNKLIKSADETKNPEDYEKAKDLYRSLYEENKETLWQKFEDFYNGPYDYDKDSILEWIDNNKTTIALLSDKNFRNCLAEKDPRFNRFGKTTMYTFCSMADIWLDLYNKEEVVDQLIQDDGKEKDFFDKAVSKFFDVTDYGLQVNDFQVRYGLGKVRVGADKALYSFRKVFANDYSEDNQKFEDYTKQLSNAVTPRDSEEYKSIINTVKTFSKIDDIPKLHNDNETADLKKLNQRQQQAFKMYMIKKSIDKYVAHKVKDGINKNAYEKMNLVRNLDKFVCNRIKELNPEPFKIGNTTYDQKNYQIVSADGLGNYTNIGYEKDSIRNMVQFLNDKAVDLTEYGSGEKLNLDESEDIMKKLIDSGSIIYDGNIVPAGTDPNELMNNIREWDDDPEKIKPTDINPHSWIYVLDSKKDEYIPLCVQPGVMQDSSRREELTIKNAHIWKNMNQIKNVVTDLNGGLAKTNSIWSSDSKEYKKVAESLEALDKKIRNLNVTTLAPLPNSDLKKMVANNYSYEKLANEFTEVLSSIGDYVDSHKNVELSSRQIERLEKMNEIQSVYDAIKLATVQKPGYDNKPFVLEQKHIDRQKTIDKICFESLKNMGLEYYKFALTDRSFFKTVRGKMLKNKNFLNDFATLRADSVMKFDKAATKRGKYLSDVNELSLNNFMVDILSKNTRAASDDLEYQLAGLDKYGVLDKAFTTDERAALRAYAGERDYYPSGKDETFTQQDYGRLGNLFFTELKKGKIQVLGRDGKPAEFANALAVLGDKINHPDKNPALYRYDENSKSFVGKDFVFEESHKGDTIFLTSSVDKLTPVKFKETSVSVSNDMIQVCDKVHEQLFGMRKELKSANAIVSKQNREDDRLAGEMSDAIESLYHEFNKPTSSVIMPSKIKDEVAKLNEKAVNYITAHYKQNIDDKQFDRLAVAQKIIAINEAINEPNLTYKNYLTQQCAKKAALDFARFTREKAKNNPKDEFLKKTNSFNLVDMTRTGNAQNEHGHNEKFTTLHPNYFMNTDEFKAILESDNIEDLENLFYGNLKETVETLNFKENKGIYEDTQDVQNKRAEEAEKANQKVEKAGQEVLK